MKYKVIKLFPGCKWDIGDIISDKDIIKAYKIDVGSGNEYFESVDENSIQYFKNGWKSLTNLIYTDIKNRKIWIWCEYPGGGEARELEVRMLTDNPYIFCDVIFEHPQVRKSGQGAVCYSLMKNESSPYVSDKHREIWREIVKITGVRTIRYKV